MPVDFPDLDSLKEAAKIHKFRSINENETEDDYRNVLADHVSDVDFIESQEIRNKIGWDQWDSGQELDSLLRVTTKK
jgi:hypothetical protein